VQLQVFSLQNIAAPVLGKHTPNRDRVLNELVGESLQKDGEPKGM
jgi:hypothetical protein